MSVLRVAFAIFVLIPNALTAAAPASDELPKCPPGWKVELVAAVPKIQHPSVVCCAPDGRIFVGEDPMDMGNDSKKPTDRILCFHPDGKVTVFAENLHAVFGLAYLDGKLFVHHVPKFSVFTDDNGVGKDRKDLIDCTNPNPAPGFNDHIPANIRLGMDGWFYMSTGDKGIYGEVGVDGSKAEIQGGGVMRFRPDGSHLEVFSTGTRNHLDVAINAEDEIFTYDNTDDGNGWWTRVTHMVDGGFYGYPWDYKPRRPYTLWMMTDFGGGSPTGAIAYNDDALPAEYRGNLFLCEWGRKQLLRLKVERDGGSYKILKREDFLTSGSKEFRPVGIAVTPDGMGFYVADWNFGGWKQNTPAGRLLKVTYTGKSEATAKPAWFVPAAMGKAFDATTAELVEGLKHPAQSVRLVAQRRVAERGAEAVKPLVALLADPKSQPFAKWSAIWTLDAIDGGKTGRDAILAALADPDVSVRRQAIRQLGGSGQKDAVPALIKQLDDADASIRFQAATALGRLGSVEAVPALRKALGQSDLFARYAAFHALNRIGRADGKAWPAIVAGLAEPATGIQEGTLFALRDTFDASLVAALRELATDRKYSVEARALAIEALAPLQRKPQPWTGGWWGTQPVRSPKPAGVVDWAGTPVVIETMGGALQEPEPLIRRSAARMMAVSPDPKYVPLLIGLFPKDSDQETRRAVLQALAAAKNPAAAANFVLDLVQRPDRNADLIIETVALAERVGGPKIIAALSQLTADVKAKPEALVALLATLGRLKAADAVSTIAGLLAHPDQKVKTSAVEALTAIGGPDAARSLALLVADPKLETRKLAVTALGAIKNPAAVEPLLLAFADPALKTDAVTALSTVIDPRAIPAYLVGLGSKNGTVRDACRKAIVAFRAEAYPLIEKQAAAGQLSPEVVGELQLICATRLPLAWSAIGPLPSDAPAPPGLATSGSQEEFTGIDNKKVRWTTPGGTDRNAPAIDLNKALNPPRPKVAGFMHAELYSPVAGEVELAGDIQGGTLTLNLNGEKVYESDKPGRFTAKVKLIAGRNQLLARSVYQQGSWRLGINAAGSRGGPLFAAKAINPISSKEYSDFAVKTKGNLERGKFLFADSNGLACIKCHRASPAIGGEVGPDLAGVGAKYNREQLIESILLPSKQILDGYQQTRIQTADGRTLLGVVRGETPDEITLLDVDGRKTIIKKADIEERKMLEKSLMPEGLQGGLSREDFADVIAYLESLREKPPEKK